MVKSQAHYEFRKITDSSAAIVLERRGNHTQILTKGCSFGIRPAGSSKGMWRVIMPNTPTIIFSVDQATMFDLTDSSKRV